MIVAWLSRMNTREKMIFYAAIFFIGAALVDRVVIHPTFNRLKFLDEQVQVQIDLIRKNTRIVAEKERVAQAKKELSRFSREAGTQEEEVAFLLGQIEKLARESSLYVVDMKPRGETEDGLTKKYTVDLTVEAQMEQVMKFMYGIEGSSLLLRVESFTISPKSNDSTIAKASMRISHIIFL